MHRTRNIYYVSKLSSSEKLFLLIPACLVLRPCTGGLVVVVVLVVWRCGRVAGSVEVDVARWSHCIVYKYLGTAFYPPTSSAGRLHVMSITYHQETLICAELNI